MDLNNLLLLSAIVLLIYFVIIGYVCFPLYKIRKSINLARRKINKDFKDKELSEKTGIEEYRLFNDLQFENYWNKYFRAVLSDAGSHKFSDITNHFNPVKIISERINTALVSILPVLFFIFSSAITVLFTVLLKLEVQAENEALIIVLCGLIILSSIMSVLFKTLQFITHGTLNEFNSLVSEIFETPCGTGEQISDIRMILEEYHSDQIKLYSKINKETSLTVLQQLKPFLETMEVMVRDYLSAISVDQQKAMEHLADYFLKNTSELYDGQLEKITDATLKMTQIQEKTTGCLENISGFFSTSSIAIEKVLNNSKEMSDSYEKYLSQMNEMSIGIESNIKLMSKMLEYIDENNKNKDFTIEKLASFQNDFIISSENSTIKMKEFFDEFKDSYSNHLIKIKEVTDNIQSAENVLENSYNNFNNNLGNISEFFKELKEGINEVRENSNDMSAIYKENLEQLQSVNKLVKENINSSSNLTEYINNSLKSNNFTIEKLSEFQKELIDVSDRSGKAMNEFFTDFKDHYSSYIIAMKAASADMQKSGEIVKESYSGFASNLDKDVTGVFMKFEENLTEISIRFARSIKDLQDAVDELPEIFKGIKKES